VNYRAVKVIVVIMACSEPFLERLLRHVLWCLTSCCCLFVAKVATNVRHMTPTDIEEEIEKVLADWKTRLSVTDVVEYIKDAAQVCRFQCSCVVTVTVTVMVRDNLSASIM
jgi:hypothetical protein